MAKKRDPYSWAGKLDVDGGPVPLLRWTPHRLGTIPAKPTLADPTVHKGKKGQQPPFVTK